MGKAPTLKKKKKSSLKVEKWKKPQGLNTKGKKEKGERLNYIKTL